MQHAELQQTTVSLLTPDVCCYPEIVQTSVDHKLRCREGTYKVGMQECNIHFNNNRTNSAGHMGASGNLKTEREGRLQGGGTGQKGVGA